MGGNTDDVSNDRVEEINIILDDKVTEKKRKRVMWWVSLLSIITTIILIIGLVIFTIIPIFISIYSNNTSNKISRTLSNYTNIWHIYLISLISLSTLFSILVYINKSTWNNIKIDKNEDNEQSIISSSQLISLLLKLVSKHEE